MNVTSAGERFRKVESLYQQAADLPAERRAAFLAEKCASDIALREEIESLLHHYDIADGMFLLQPTYETSPTVALPERIGRYRIVRLIGEGGMGRVFQARQDSPRRNVAVKVIRTVLASTESLRRIEYEAAILARLQHPGIAHVYEAGVAECVEPDGRRDRSPFFAMELIDGLALHRFVQPALDMAARLQLFAQICDAVEHAHQKGIIHRDLKPANILVTPDGTPKVLDFGVARATNADLALTTMHTQVEQLVGTVPYMSPEQAEGKVDQLDTRSDVYSLGVILYELLAGRLPYDLAGKNIAAAARAVCEADPLPLGQVNRACRGDLETIVRRALEKDPARRYASVHALASDVRRYLRREPIEARRDSPWYVVRKLVDRHRLAVTAAAAFVLLLAISTAVLTVLYAERGRLLERAQSAETRHRQRFDQVRSLARSLMFDLHPKIERLAGATPARVFLIQSAIAYLDSLARESIEEPDLAREIAEAYQRLAALQGNPNYVNIGDRAGALESYEKSQIWFERLARLIPDDLYAQRMIGMVHSGRGDVLAALGQVDDAESAYRLAFGIADDLDVRFPQAWEVRMDVALGHVKLAAMSAQRAMPEQALDHRRRAVELFASVVARQPENDKARTQLAVAHLQVGDSLSAAGDSAAALDCYEKSLAIRRELSTAAPDNIEYQRSVAIAWQRVGNAHAALANDAGLSLESYRASLAIFERLARADAEDVRAQRDLSVAYEKIGVVAFNAQRWEEALDAFRLSRDIRQHTVATSPDNPEAVSDLVISLAKFGRTCSEMGDDAAAIESFESAIGHADALHRRDPAHAGRIRLLAMVQSQFGGVFTRLATRDQTSVGEQLAHRRAARQWLVQARDTLLAGRDPRELPPADSRDIQNLDGEIQDCDRAIESVSESPRPESRRDAAPFPTRSAVRSTRVRACSSPGDAAGRPSTPPPPKRRRRGSRRQSHTACGSG